MRPVTKLPTLLDFIADNKRNVSSNSLSAKEGFRYEDEMLMRIKAKVFDEENTVALGDLFDIRRGYETGESKVYIITEEFYNILKSSEFKYSSLASKIIHGKYIDSDYTFNNFDYLLKIDNGFTDTVLKEPLENKEAYSLWFKEEYPLIYNYFLNSVDIDRFKYRSTSNMGKFWWESVGASKYFETYSRYLAVQLIGYNFNCVVLDNNNNLVPDTSLVLMLPKFMDCTKLHEIQYFLNKPLLPSIWLSIIATNVLGGKMA